MAEPWAGFRVTATLFTPSPRPRSLAVTSMVIGPPSVIVTASSTASGFWSTQATVTCTVPVEEAPEASVTV